MEVSVVIGGFICVLGLVFDIFGIVYYHKIYAKAGSAIESLKVLMAQKTPADATLIKGASDTFNSAMEYFSKLSAPVQFAVLGTLHIAAGLYLIIIKPL